MIGFAFILFRLPPASLAAFRPAEPSSFLKASPE